MRTIRVAVIRGGPSAEYAVSMQTGAQVLEALRGLGYDARDIIVSQRGEWLEHGLARTPEQHLNATDMVFIAMHGAYGEDGTVQKVCERMHIPFSGSNSFASRVAFNKHLTKQSLSESGIALPKHIKLTREDIARLRDIADTIRAEYTDGFVIKPIDSGSSHGVKVVANAEDLITALTESLAEFETLLLEERIVGTEATCGVLEHFRSQRHYVLPAIEIVPPAGATHFDMTCKYDGRTDEICPGRFSFAEKAAIAEAALTVHTSLGLSHYSRSDFIIKNGQPYFLEVNTLPGLTSQSLFPKAAAAVGVSFPELIEHLVQTARVRD